MRESARATRQQINVRRNRMSETRSKTTRAAAPGDVAAGGPRLGLALLVLATAQLMVVLDATIVNVALPHTRAFGVYAAMSIAGGAIGLIGGGLLTTYASWRWVLFVNVPIGAAVALAAPRVLAETPRRRGRFDLPASLAAAAVLLAAFAVIETRSPQALLPVRLLRDRNRTGAYLSYAGVGIFIFGMFFFLTVFMQAVWGYSALKTGVAYLPFTAALFTGAGAVAQLVPKTGARPILLAGSAASTGGLYWLSRISEHDTYASAVLGPTIVIGAGAALLFVTLSLVALNRVAEADAGVASSLLNTGQQLGGSIGLALLGTVAWTVVAHSSHAQAAAAARAGHPARPGGPLAAAIYNHALATGFARAFLAAAGIALLTLIINLAVIRVRRVDLAGAQQPEPAMPADPAQPAVTAKDTNDRRDPDDNSGS